MSTRSNAPIVAKDEPSSKRAVVSVPEQTVRDRTEQQVRMVKFVGTSSNFTPDGARASVAAALKKAGR
jgi:hypothetical protein